MARYIGPVCRLCRREGMKLFLKGERCHTEKCAIEKRNFVPGQHGKDRKAEDRRLRPAASRKAEGPPLLSAARRPVPQPVRKGQRNAKGITGENLLGMLGTPPGQRDLPHGLRHQPRAGAPDGPPRPHPGEWPQGQHPFVPGEARTTSSKSARSSKNNPTILAARDATAHAPTPELAGSGSGSSARAECWLSPSAKSWCRSRLNEQLIVELYSK